MTQRIEINMSNFDNSIDDLINDVTASRVQDGLFFVEDMTTAWVSERNSPEILPFRTLLLEGAMNKLRLQIEFVESVEATDDRSAFKLVIMQTEMERIKFLIRSYLRARIAKIDRYLILCNRDDSISGRLSAFERHYAEKHQIILERHYHMSFLKDAPVTGNFRKLDDTGAAGLSMIDRPDLNRSVFCKVIKSSELNIKTASEIRDLEIGSIVLIRYSLARPYLLNDSFQLL